MLETTPSQAKVGKSTKQFAPSPSPIIILALPFPPYFLEKQLAT